MAALPINTDQATIVNNFKTKLETAFTDGVVALAEVVSPINGYAQFPAATKEIAKIPFDSLIAAFIKELNINQALPNGISATVILAKITPSGTSGSLTFVNGILVSKVDPT